ncbi:hypothetical protein B0H11DRAFT_2394891 [Mycena galericulata]|nr:hypothetical protein B0H11DRAFT_2394891 [Mycena galericulata]
MVPRAAVLESNPPTYRVDLSAPPEERYREICSDFKPYLADITREIRGISKLTGVPLHLVVAYNTFLDLFSGCSSGGARVIDAGNGHQSGVVHFRGLDWEMEPLRKSSQRAVTYAGYTGILTGVRSGLSVSLNYRPLMGSPSSVLSHRLHQSAMLLGFRPSIASILREILLSPNPPPRDLPLFCTPLSVLVLEKDLVTAVARTSPSFLAVTNHDQRMENLTPEQFRALLEVEGMGHHALVDDSLERKQCVSQMWPQKGDAGLKVADVAQQMEVRPVLNEATHFSCIMDPAVDGGGLLWVHAYAEPVEMDDLEYSDVVSDDVASD